MKLRVIYESDIRAVMEWSRDKTFCQANSWSIDRDPEELQRWWMKYVKCPPENLIRMGIVLDEELIGYTDLVLINEHAAEIGIAIGKSELWGKGIGAQAVDLVMAHGTEAYNLTTFFAETHEANIRSGKMLAKLGFQEVSRVGYEDYEGKNSRLVQYELLKE
ncbi:GNAT family N-acetyltransferase [Jeotgalibacillus malaysiensis]|uniref:GNAT family N-acetyltransferase n=1 Tax=Jeotgalibacillus malaysiensis TaxID=1508404 RepID=UPI00384BE5F2